jgi:hypothetical protein
LLTYADTTSAVMRNSSSSAGFGVAGSAMSPSIGSFVSANRHNRRAIFGCQPKLLGEHSNNQ